MRDVPLANDFDEPERLETLEQARDRFNERFAERHAIGLASQSLPPMFVPGAVFLERMADIGINSTLLQPPPVGLLLMVQRYPNMQAGDCLEVLWHVEGLQATPVATLFVSPEQVNQDVPLFLATEKTVDGIAALYCRITRNGSAVGRSAPLQVLCKPSLPGGPDPTPDTPWHGGLTAPSVAPVIESGSLDDYVEVQVPPWLYMHAGGTLQVMWGTQVFEQRFADDEVDHPIVVQVPAVRIRESGSCGALPVRYRIIDVVGDASAKWSAACQVNVQLQPGLLDAPRVHGAVEAQVLPEGACRVLVWASTQQAVAGDVIELEAVGITHGGQRLVLALQPQKVEEAGRGYLFELPEDDLRRLAGGWLSLGHQLVRDGQVIGRSLKRYLEVPGTPPALAFPEPDSVVNGTLDPDLAEVAVTLRYDGLARGDRVKLYWHGQTAGGLPYVWEVAKTVSRVDGESGSTRFLVAGGHLKALAHGTLHLRYSVANSTLGVPLQSPALWLRVGTLPDELPPPKVAGLDAEGDVLFVAGQGLRVDIPLEAGLQPGDQVALDWLGVSAEASLNQAGTLATFQIPPTVLAAGIERHSEVKYRVTRRVDQRVQASARLTLTVTAGQPLVLGPAQVMEAAADGSIDPLQVPPQGATVLFQSQAQGLRPGDRIVLHIEGAQREDSEPLLHEPEHPLSFLIPARLITATLGSTLSVSYSVLRGERSKGTSPVARHPVYYRLNVDTRLLLLNGLSVKYPKWSRTGVDSIGNTAVRKASGGQAPFAYQSSAPAVASVDASGKVTGNANGHAIITVRDRQQQAISYPVQVSNVWNLNLRTDRPWTWKNAVQWMNGVRGSPANAQVIADLQRVYGAPLPVPRYLWNCVQVSHDAGQFYHHNYAFSSGICIANTPNTNIYGAMCITPRNA